MSPTVQHPDDPQLDDLCGRLRLMAGLLDLSEIWPSEQMQLCGDHGVYRWFMPTEWGGFAWSDAEITRGYLKLGAACLTTTFVLTQRTGACQRIIASDNEDAKRRWLPGLASGEQFATVGISHLTTSRRHLAQPVLTAAETSTGWRLNGFSPWVTGADQADVVVVGATLEDGRQILAAVPADTRGVSCAVPANLIGLAASRTGEFRCDHVEIPADCLLAGPAEDVMRRGKGAGTGGLQTSALAIGLASAAVRFLETESQRRPEFADAAASLRMEHSQLEADLLQAADGRAVCSSDELRSRANSLALRGTQSALACAKGAGYIVGHPAGRWCREALFFLVWSCPQPVIAANLCELASLE
jgi:alkylation response protein AidB-like acyl-CoA dehydrogenase